MNADRLSSLDVAFLALERPSRPLHLGGVAVFRPARRVNAIRLVDMLAERARRVPRLRQRVRPTWLPPGGAVWAADPGFDPARHIHLRRLPAPGTRTQLGAAVSEAMATPLDLNRPLWEIHVLTGLQDGSFAVLTKLHHALADGLRAVTLGVSLLDEARSPAPAAADGTAATGAAADRTTATGGDAAVDGAAAAAAGGGGLAPILSVARSAGAALVRPGRMLTPALSTVSGVTGAARQTGQALGIAASMLRSAAPPPPRSPWTTLVSPERSVAMLRIDLRDVHQIRGRHGGTVNDVLLTVLTGALRRWLASQGTRVDDLTLRALIPVSWPRRSAACVGGNTLSGYLCDLPVSEPDPLGRLRAVRAEMDRNKAAGPHRGPGALPLLADRLPPAVHRLAGPLAGLGAPLLFDTVVTSVPLPNVTLHLDGAELREIYPIVPLAHGHALGVAISTYRGMAHLVVHADRRAVADLAGLAAAVPAAVTTLARVPYAS